MQLVVSDLTRQTLTDSRGCRACVWFMVADLSRQKCAVQIIILVTHLTDGQSGTETTPLLRAVDFSIEGFLEAFSTRSSCQRISMLFRVSGMCALEGVAC